MQTFLSPRLKKERTKFLAQAEERDPKTFNASTNPGRRENAWENSDKSCMKEEKVIPDISTICNHVPLVISVVHS